MTEYPPPSWSRPPSHDWQLIEIKEGQEIATYNLQTALITFGRAADVVTIPLAHESCSRLHARIAFDGSGRPWLRDLMSTHGVTVNKRKLPPEASTSKTEPIDATVKGSRGVMLFPGDLIQFGASSRMYVLEGPAEMERGAREMKEKLDKILKQHVPDTTGTSPSEDPTQDPPDDPPDDPPSLALAKIDASQLSEKIRKQHESLQTKKAKLQHIETESERIQSKGELTDGQTRQLSLNRERSTKLEEEIAQTEQELYEKIFGKPIQKQQDQQFAANDEDDVDDRTAQTSQRHISPTKAEDEASLTSKWRSLQEQWIQSQKVLEKSRQRVSQLEMQLQSSAEGDEELFFLQNDLSLARDNQEKAHEHRKWLELDFKETESLLRLVNDKIQFDRDIGFIGVKQARETTTTMPPPSGPVPAGEGTMLPPPVKIVKPILPSPSQSALPLPKSPRDKSISMPPPDMMPPAKRTRVLPPPKESMAAPIAKGPLRPTGTLAFLLPGHESSQESKKGKSTVQATFDEKKDVWVAPKGQDGSGKTRLNDKFAGRY